MNVSGLSRGKPLFAFRLSWVWKRNGGNRKALSRAKHENILFFVRGEWERDKEGAGNIPTCQTIEIEPSPECPNAKKGVVSPAIDMILF